MFNEFLQSLHFDPANAIIMLGVGIYAWFKVRGTVNWHTAWIRQHDIDDKKRDDILQQCRETNAKLTVLVETHCDRLERIETRLDRAT